MGELIYSQSSFYALNYKYTTNNLEFSQVNNSLDSIELLQAFIHDKLPHLLYNYNLVSYGQALEEVIAYALQYNLVLNFHCDSNLLLRQIEGNKHQEQTMIAFRAILIDPEQKSTITKDFQLDENETFSVNIKEFINEFVAQRLYSNTEVEYDDTSDSFIFAPQAAAYLVHEIFGHMLEHDYIKAQNSIYNEQQLGIKLFHSDITVIDDPSQGSQIGLFFGKYQHTGEELLPQTLIRKGVLENFVKSSRVDRIKNEPCNRMYNLYLDKNPTGKDLSSLISGIKKGYLIATIDNAFVDPSTGFFHLQCRHCYKIDNGKKSKIIPVIILQGDSSKILMNTLHVGNDLKFFASQCAKNGQILSVGTGAPSLLLHSSLFSVII